MIFQDDIPLISIVSFKGHYVLVLDLTSLQDGNENCLFSELVREILSLHMNLTTPLQHVIELIVMGERKSLVAVG